MKKITFINGTAVSLGGLQVWGSWQVRSARHKSSKILIFTWKFRFYHWQKILSVVFLKETGSLHSFLRKSLPNAILEWVWFSCQLFFQVKMVFHEKKWPLTQDNPHAPVGIRSAVYLLPIVSYTTRYVMYDIGVAQGSRLNILYCFIKTFLSETSIVFLWQW